VKYHCRNIGLETLRELVDRPGELLEYLKQPVTPGRLLMYLEEKGIKLKVSEEVFLEEIIKYCEEEVDAVHGEGFWIDHWTYNLDLIESYLGVYPEKKRELLFKEPQLHLLRQSIHSTTKE